MSMALNKVHLLTFSKQCKGAGITAIDLMRADAHGEPRLRYRARDARTGKVFQGDWALEKEGAGTVEEQEKAVQALLEKEFAVTRR